MSDLAIMGGKPSCDPPVNLNEYRARRFDNCERVAIERVFDSGALCRTFGIEASALEKEMCAYFSKTYAVACSSGTASIHTALAAAGVKPGSEVITSPITDMGTLIGIIAQGALPVFADLEPDTFNMRQDLVLSLINERTSAVLPVHLAGLACEMDEILNVCAERGIPVIEDAAQSWLAADNKAPVGTRGTVGCFSLNGYKHISCGDGGVSLTDDPVIARRMRLFVDKAYDREGGSRNPEFFAMNYRITELQAAVAREQLKKLSSIVSRRRQIAGAILEHLENTPGVILPHIPDCFNHSWWYIVLRRNPAEIEVSADTVAEALAAEGIPAWTGYAGGKPVYLYDCFSSGAAGRPGVPAAFIDSCISYREGLCPVAEELVREMIIISMSEFYTSGQVESMARGIDKVFRHYSLNRH